MFVVAQINKDISINFDLPQIYRSVFGGEYMDFNDSLDAVLFVTNKINLGLKLTPVIAPKKGKILSIRWDLNKYYVKVSGDPSTYVDSNLTPDFYNDCIHKYQSFSERGLNL